MNQKRELCMTQLQNEPEELDIYEMIGRAFKALMKCWIPAGLLTLALAIGSFLYTWKTYVPYYQSQVTFTVNTQDSALLLYGSNGAKQIQESLPYILKSQYMENLVMEDLGLTSFPASIELESKELANFYVLKVNARDPQTAYDVINSVVKNCPKASVYVLGKVSFEILDGATVASAPYNRMDKTASVLKGAALGIVLSGAVILLYVMTNRTIQTEEDLKKYLSAQCLASVPQVSFKKRRKKISKTVHIYNDVVGGTFLETIRALRTRVQRSMEQLNAKTVLVTSSVSEEGKSTIAANLALSLAENGSRVILVDLDLRNPSAKALLGKSIKLQNGIAEVLKGECKWTDTVCEVKKWNLHILFGGHPESNPMKLINSDAFEKLIAQLEEQYDYIVLDTPPVAMLSDASAIAMHADCAVYVVKQDYARVERISEGMEALNYAQVPILGVVINGMEKAAGRYGSSRRFQYGNYGANGRSYQKREDAPAFVDLGNPWEEQ